MNGGDYCNEGGKIPPGRLGDWSFCRLGVLAPIPSGGVGGGLLSSFLYKPVAEGVEEFLEVANLLCQFLTLVGVGYLHAVG